MKRVYVLLVNWNGWADTIECLESVFRLDYPVYKVIVCDNDSSDDSIDKIVDWAEGRIGITSTGVDPKLVGLTYPPIEKPISYTVYDRTLAEKGGDRSHDPSLILIRTGGNLGFAGGNNVGLRYALARDDFAHVWLLNNDTVVDSRALAEMVERMDQAPGAGMCGSTLAFYGQPERIQARGGGWYCKWIGLPWHIGQLGKVSDQVSTQYVEKRMNYVVGASMLVSREMLLKTGLMCEDYFLFFEEVDWALRCKGLFKLGYASDSLVYHKLGKSIGTASNPARKSAVCDYYSIRNRLVFTRKFFPTALLTIYPSLVFALLHRLIHRRYDLVRMVWNVLLGRDAAP
jgi:hypothetical protein